MDITHLLIQLEMSGFRDRESLAGQAARELDAAQLDALSTSLRHAHANVRQGVMEVLAVARHRNAIPALLKLAQERTGDDRVFAIRTLARLVTPEDQSLQGAAEGFARHADPFVQAQGQALLRSLGNTPKPPPAQPSPVVMVNVPAADLALLMLAAQQDSVRIRLSSEIEALARGALAITAGHVLREGNADCVALMARVLTRQAARIPREAHAELLKLCDFARTRHVHSPLCADALDSCVMALGGGQVVGALLARVQALDPAHVTALVQQLLLQPPETLGEVLPLLVTAVQRHPSTLTQLAPALLHVMPALRPSWKQELKTTVQAAALVLPEALVVPVPRGEIEKLEQLAQLMVHTCEAGEPTPARLFLLADRLPAGALHRILMEVCLKLKTEDAALRLAVLMKDPDGAMRRDAADAAVRFRSPNVELRVDAHGEPEVHATYRAAAGEMLTAAEHRLTQGVTQDAYVLDGKGHPVREKDTELGGCRCCLRPRALMRGRQPMVCPQTGFSHVTEGGKNVLERNHPLGRCHACETARALVREGARVVCPACRQVHSGGLTPLTPVPASTAPGADPSRKPDAPFKPNRAEDAVPKPPSKADMQLVGHAIARAMAANVFIIGEHDDMKWCGSGIVVGRNGNELAILTNRHVIKDEDAKGVASLKALTIAGELVTLEPIWMASAGVDLALCVARCTQTDGIGVMELGSGAALMGSPLFAIGNLLGLSWSYSSGSLSAFRRWKTDEGLELRYLQTQVPIGPGSSGGGLYHQDGHMVGIICFMRVGELAGDAAFALSVESIREALLREDVQWNGKPLAEVLPP